MEPTFWKEMLTVGGPVLAGIFALVGSLVFLSNRVLKPLMDSTAQAAKDNAVAAAAVKDATLAAQATVQAANQIMRVAQHLARLDDEGVQRP